MITSSNTMALNNHYATALGPRLGLGLRLDFGSQVWFVQYFSENLVVVLYAGRGGRKTSHFRELNNGDRRPSKKDNKFLKVWAVHPTSPPT